MFTVRQLAKLAGITPRTLHYYHQIGLLIPTQVGENGYRYYGAESLLQLQQILFFRALDLPLEQIKHILSSRDFDVLQALESHRAQLHQRIARMERLIHTVDQTILHLKGKTTMRDRQFFEGFSDEQQAAYEQEAMQIYDPATVKAANQKWKRYTAAEKQRIGDEGSAVYQALLDALPKGAASPEAQAAVERWRRHIAYFWTPADAQLLGLADGYNDDPRFKANFDQLDPRLAEFLRAAVQVYVQNRQQ